MSEDQKVLSFSIKGNFVKGSGKRKTESTDDDQKDFVTGISGTKIESLQPEEVHGPLVIPMPEIKPSKVGARYQKYLKKEDDVMEIDKKDTDGATTIAQAGTEDEIRKQAEEELLKEAQGVEEFEENNNEAPIDLPLLVKYRNPDLDDIDNENERFRVDVASRPEESTIDDYERIPVEKFGEAYLRGNNWKPGDPVGLTNKKVVEPREFVVRPGYRTGLGVKPEDIVAPQKKKKYIKPGESREDQEIKVLTNEDGTLRSTKGLDEKLVPLSKTQMQVGSLVGIIAGPHEGLYARVIKMYESTDSVLIQLQSSHEEIKVPKSDLTLMDERKLNKEHPALKMGSESSKKGSSSSKKDDKEKRKDYKDDDKKDKQKDTGSSSEDKDSWIYPGLVVRIVSKTFSDGKYYLKKGKIVDVITKSECTVQLLDTKKLVEAKQRYLETVIPKELQEKVMIVQGANKGKIGTLMSKEKVGGETVAVVQLQVDFSVSHYSLDAICQFIPDKSM